jgi:DNA invertase Pin-like site-specific DNA recombinase
LYARVSKDEKADDERYQNPENQLSPLREYAKLQGWTIVKEYVDQKSGASPNRTAFKELRSDAHKNIFDGVLIWKIDRFSREGISTTLAYIEQFKTLNIWIKSMTEDWLNTKDEGIGMLMLSIMAWAAAEERKKISERTKAGIAEKRKLGTWSGGRPKRCLTCGWSHKAGNPCKEPNRLAGMVLPSPELPEKHQDKDFISEIQGP